VVYVTCALEFYLRFLKDRPIREISTSNAEKGEIKHPMDTRMKIMMGGLAFSSLCLFIRYVNHNNKPSP
jgi:hypothetical protein